jgi:hypothetical protein
VHEEVVHVLVVGPRDGDEDAVKAEPGLDVLLVGHGLEELVGLLDVSGYVAGGTAEIANVDEDEVEVVFVEELEGLLEVVGGHELHMDFLGGDGAAGAVDGAPLDFFPSMEEVFEVLSAGAEVQDALGEAQIAR